METRVTWNQVLTKTFGDFFENRGSELGAALAFYTAFSVVPLLMISVSIATLFFGADAVEGQLEHQLVAIFGDDIAAGLQGLIAAGQKVEHSRILRSLMGAAALLFGATGVFVELKSSMNLIWGVEVRPELGIWGALKDSAVSFIMVAVTALLLLFSMILTSLISAIGKTIELTTSAQMTDFVVSTTVTVLLFAMIFKYLPDVKVFWKDVWIGACATGVLFTIGKHVVGVYLANTSISTAYGAGSSIFAFLLWTYYSAQIFFFGAEFTQVLARLKGRGIEPSTNARFTSRTRRTRQRSDSSVPAMS